MEKILIVEDDEKIARVLQLELEFAEYDVTLAYTGKQGIQAFQDNSFDLILLDVMLPELNGLEVARRIRQVSNVPIMMMTARDSVIDRVSGFDHGADDYITKPFAIEELLARVRALGRRINIENEKNEVKQTTLEYRDLVVEKENRVVRRESEIIELTKREYELLVELMSNLNIVLSREVLLDKVWEYEKEAETNIVDVYIRYLRNKLDTPGNDSYIQTVRGMGYVMRT